ncbi:tubulin polyglutamylase TTLL13 isoform X2 [Pogoniulus pusillus]|uniref:tubulin polyglutamylase TTLL13 isoform X2 n=1 Tax=Pogoniulus pusillus TaxID=488313 RepID=UPI0030B99565
MEMKRFQRINHFPGMIELCRKDLLARNLNRMLRLFPKDYNIFPRTWCLPADYGDFQAYRRTTKRRTFICKPESSCQGRGIFITHNPEEIRHGEHMICQQYISKDDICMHLTNYAINKNNQNFIQDDRTGSKRKLSTLNAWMTANSYNTTKLWEDIEDIIIKTLISAHPVLKHNYQSCFPSHTTISACFEILGFDILLDRKMKPWLLEVNHSPSFSTDTAIDCEVKDALLCDTLTLINLHACNKRKVLEEDKQRVKERLLQGPQTLRAPRHEELEAKQAAWLEQVERYEESHCGGYRRIYPAQGTERYEPFFRQSSSLFQETVASRAREQCARQQLEEIRLKKEKLEAVTRKKKKERKDDLHGESAWDKSQLQNKPTVPTTHLTHRRTRVWDRKAQHMQYDSTQPQDIVEHEEKRRVKALLQRENLIRGLGLIHQLCQLLPAAPRPAHTQGSCTAISRSQLQFPTGVLRAQDPQHVMRLVPLSLLRTPVQPSGPRFTHDPRAKGQMPPSLGMDPATVGSLWVQGQSIPSCEQQRVWSTGWLRGRAARPAAVTQREPTQPSAEPAWLWQLPTVGSTAEGCEAGTVSSYRGSCHLVSPASPGKTSSVIFSPAAVRELPIASATLTPHTPGLYRASASHHASAKSAGNVAEGHPDRSLVPAQPRCTLKAAAKLSAPFRCGRSWPLPRRVRPAARPARCPEPGPRFPGMAALVGGGLRAAALLLRRLPRRAAATRGTSPPASELESERARRQRRAARMQRMRRELGERRGAPERTLTWQAMEQMRFLRQELPEEWPLERLAQGFGVSLDVVRRVLRSRNCPPPHRQQRQDQRALNAAPGPRLTQAPGQGYEVRAPDGTLLYRLPRGRGGPGPGAQ